jgi:hypothetical protein
MKKEYIRPEVFVVTLGDDILQVITQGSDTNDFAKENSIDFGDDIDSDEPYRDLWED